MHDKVDVGISMIEDIFGTLGVPAPGQAAPLTAVVQQSPSPKPCLSRSRYRLAV